MRTWLDIKEEPELKSPIAIVGSQGLRSVGLIAIEHLIQAWGARQMASMYSKNLPIIYQGVPYAGVPGLPGSLVKEDGTIEFPKVYFFFHDRFIIVKGYNPDGLGQYHVGREVVKYLKDLGVAKIVTLGGFVQQEEPMGETRKVSFCATNTADLETLRNAELKVHYTGPFLGFSALVLGMAHESGIPGFGLFGQTEPLEENPLLPDPPASQALLEKLSQVLEVEIDTTNVHPPEALHLGEELMEFFEEDRDEDDVSYI